ncbi:MAG: DUF1844 domain-containing protein [Candidatus Tectomicrobia bacterium]|uniref:DUF1844 domain-containing protein n=1 Tax=Tectimicrobiota bacterium TaxID=2528274 RepID=A0A932FZL7_UNCTE|nr:DUF1844 domain-containing protein [Candidatus Tectomicrobia bacterium]
MSEEQEGKSFTVTDKRIAARQQEKEAGPETSPAGQGEPEERKARGERLKERILRRIRGTERESEEEPVLHPEEPLPEIDFAGFIFSLSSSALLHLGEIPDPISHRKEKDLLQAKQMIDILGMLQEKTKGNLTAEEEQLMQNILYDLRMRYVQAAG